jgi:hypothetical protein
MNKFIIIDRQLLCDSPDFGGYPNKLSYYLTSFKFIKYKKFYDLYPFRISGVYECKDNSKLSENILKIM